MIKTRFYLKSGRASLLALASCILTSSPLFGLELERSSLTGLSPQGGFTAYQNQIHYWTASDGYLIYDVTSAQTQTIGFPENGVRSNGFGDAFGVYDSASNLFYAATLYGTSDSNIYAYNHSTGSWNTSGPEGVTIVNAYGGKSQNGQLYISGLAEPWNGSYGQDNYIFAYDHTATVGGEDPRHDTLIQTAGNSADLAIASNGDTYYASYSTNVLYKWSGDQIASVTDDLYAPDAIDNFLTLADASETWTLPGSGNGLAVDEGGNVFFAVNDSMDFSHTLGMLDASAPNGYQVLASSSGYADWYGSISVDGDFTEGDPLYFSPGWGSDLEQLISIPEPSTLTLAFIVIVAGFIFKRKHQR
ncbi:hypothetical protein P3T73_13430 [Kiritimatiellota bacterium B12222]|nr:hypothetical protein P3T73_13430 [Kiritimatiellota bacterium B12222]